MTLDLALPLLGLALAGAMTPGPNNLMLLASGANFGVVRTLPHMLGIALGFPAMIFCVGLGVMQLFAMWPPLHDILTVFSIAYLLWLAWKVAKAGAPDTAQAKPEPLSFVQAAAFQWVNPKAWAMALNAITIYASGKGMWAVLWVSGTFVVAGVASTTSWTVLGSYIQRVLTNPTRLRVFNVTMALLMVASVLPVLLH